MPEFITREQLATFLHALRQSHMRVGTMTPAVMSVIALLEEFVAGGGVLVVRNEPLEAAVASTAVPIDVESPAAASTPLAPDPDIPF